MAPGPPATCAGPRVPFMRPKPVRMDALLESIAPDFCQSGPKGAESRGLSIANGEVPLGWPKVRGICRRKAQALERPPKRLCRVAWVKRSVDVLSRLTGGPKRLCSRSV